MTQKDRELLLKDLCSRLPYGVKYMDILNPDEHPSTLQSIDNCGLVMANDGFSHEIENVKPYLFPMSSMSEEQRIEYDYLHSIIFSCFEDGLSEAIAKLYNWLNENHFDYNNLIPKGLAIDATDKNVY